MTELSPVAQKIVDAYENTTDKYAALAAVIRAAATLSEAEEIRMGSGLFEFDEVIRVSDLNAIADELEGGQ